MKQFFSRKINGSLLFKHAAIYFIPQIETSARHLNSEFW